MRLKIRHETRYAYDPEPLRVVMRLRLWPSMFDGQHPDSWVVKVNDQEITPNQITMSGFGDQTAIWTSDTPLSEIVIVAEGIVETEDRAGIVRDLPRKPPSGIFLRETALTKADDNIRALADAITIDDPIDYLHALSAAIRKAIPYKEEKTAAETTAAQALDIGEGVCQDHAHVMISAARYKKFPARYVVGYLLAHEDGSAEFESHAWAEIHVPDFGWIGFDPSNGMSPTDSYIRLASGLDADDAAPVKGCTTGGEETSHSANVAVEETGGDTGGNQHQHQQQ